jgi:hypothetical protein
MAVRTRSRKAPLPVPHVSHRGLAAIILQQVIDSGDHIAANPCSDRYSMAPSHFLLVELSEQAFRQLEQHGAETEDDEDNGDDEPDHDNEPNGGRGIAA